MKYTKLNKRIYRLAKIALFIVIVIGLASIYLLNSTESEFSDSKSIEGNTIDNIGLEDNQE